MISRVEIDIPSLFYQMNELLWKPIWLRSEGYGISIRYPHAQESLLWLKLPSARFQAIDHRTAAGIDRR